MKGPGGRIKFEIKRVWECPVCHKREFTAGDVVSRLCTCLAKSNPPRQTWMKLIEEPRKQPKPAAPPVAVDAQALPQTTQAASGQTAESVELSLEPGSKEAE
jgi:hypothetical protein